MRRREPNAVRPNIELHIEELVLDGFAPHDRHRIGATIERELARLFAEQGAHELLAQGGEVARLDGGSFHASPHTNAEALGANVARSVYKGLTR
jgi:hypothetical protein